MAFQRSDSEDVGSSRWRTEHYNELSRWLPKQVIDSDSSLTYVLLHGDDHLGTGWDPSWLTVDAAREFLGFLQFQLKDHTVYDIVREVQKRVQELA